MQVSQVQSCVDYSTEVLPAQILYHFVQFGRPLSYLIFSDTGFGRFKYFQIFWDFSKIKTPTFGRIDRKGTVNPNFTYSDTVNFDVTGGLTMAPTIRTLDYAQ